MKTTKKIIAVVLSVMLLLSVMPFAAFAEDLNGLPTVTATDSTAAGYDTAYVYTYANDASAEYANYYGDITVSFNRAIEADDVVLAGAYDNFNSGNWNVVQLRDLAAGEEFRIVKDGLVGSAVKFSQLLAITGGVFRCAAKGIDVSGVTMTVKFNLYATKTSTEAIEIASGTKTYTFPAANYVAEVNGTGYATLEEAIAAANAGDTVKLLADIDFTTDSKYAANSYSVEESYVDITGLTIDLNGKTITNNTAGLKFSGSNCVIKNGKFIGVADTYTRRYGLALWSYDAYVQGEADSIPAGAVYGQNVVLEDLEVDGGINILGHRDVIIRGCTVYGNSYYAVYLNFASDVTIESGSYTAANTQADGIVACYNAASLDPQYSAKINIEGGTFTLAKSKLVLASSGPVEISGGTYKNADSSAYTVPAKYIAEGAAQDSETGTVTQAYVAKVNDTCYETLEAAIAAANAGDTVTLLDDVTATSVLTLNNAQNLKIYLNGKTITADGNGKTAANVPHIKVYPGTQLSIYGPGSIVTANTPNPYDGALIKVYGAADDSGAASQTNIYDGAVISSSGYGISLFPAAGTKAAYNATIAVSNGTVENTSTHDAAAIAVSGNIQSGDSTITIAKATITGNSTKGVGVFVGGNASVSFNSSSVATVSGATGIYQKGGKVTFGETASNVTVTGNGASADYKFYGNGFVATGDAYVVDNCGYPAGVPVSTINNGKFTSENGEAVASYTKQDDPLYPSAEFEVVDEIIPATSTAVFSSDVSALAEDGYKTVYDETKGGYVVEEEVVEAKNGANLTLEGNIEEAIYLDANAYDLGSDAVVKVTANVNSNISETPDVQTKTYAVSSLTPFVDPKGTYTGTYKFAVKNAPAQITETVTVALYENADAQEPIETIEYSVKEYCDDVIEKSNDAKLVALCKSILDYGAAAQKEFNYNTDNMAVDTYYNADAIANLVYSDITDTLNYSTLPFTGIAFECLSTLNFNFYVTGKPDITEARVIGDEDSAIKATLKQSTKTGKIFVNVSGIEAGNLHNTFAVYTSQGSIETNLNTLVKTCLYYGSSVELAKTIYFYSNAANAYFN